jgi:hypothetical protein
MDQRAVQLRAQPGNAYWDALVLLARLYSEGSRRERAEEKIKALRKIVAENPDTVREAQIEELSRMIQIDDKRSSDSQAAVKINGTHH